MAAAYKKKPWANLRQSTYCPEYTSGRSFGVVLKRTLGLSEVVSQLVARLRSYHIYTYSMYILLDIYICIYIYVHTDMYIDMDIDGHLC